MYRPDEPNNDLPPIPVERLETEKSLKKAISASRSLAELQASGSILPNQVVLLKAILLQEARASSEIENVVTTDDALYRAFNRNELETDPQTREVLGYADALWVGHRDIVQGNPIRPSLILDIVRVIKGTDIDIRTGEGCRVVNDRTGETIYCPPIGRERLLGMLDGVCRFLAEEDRVDPLIAMAAAHRQFEAIHPFPDGNGRTGRVLNILALQQANLLKVPILYLSWFIVRNKVEYYTQLRYVAETGDWEPWIIYMLECVDQTAQMTLNMMVRVREAISKAIDIARAGMPNRYSRELIDIVFSQPYTRIEHLTNNGIAQRNAAAQYLRDMERIGILSSKKVGREVLFYNQLLVQALTLSE